MPLIATLDRRSVCAVRLDKKRHPKNLIYDDHPTYRTGPRGSFWVARLSDGVLVVTQR